MQTPWLDVFEEETVELGCEVDSPDWVFTWYKDGYEVQEDAVLTPEQEGLLNITWASEAYQGLYACKAHHETRHVSSGFSNTANVTFYGEFSCHCIV